MGGQDLTSTRNLLAQLSNSARRFLTQVNEAWDIYAAQVRDEQPVDEIEAQVPGLAREMFLAFYPNIAPEDYTPSPKWNEMARRLLQNGWRKA